MQNAATFDPVTRVIGFSVKVAGREIACRVSEDWLRDTCGSEALEEGALKAYLKRRAAIDAAALRCWLATRGAEPVSLKREHVWRQQPAASGAARAVEKHTA